MRIFVYEYACAQPGDADLPESIRVEGGAMLSALVEDFSRIPDVEAFTLEHCSGETEQAVFQRLAQNADWTVVIAPETLSVLLQRCEWVLEAGGHLLGPGIEATRLTGDKSRTAHFLDQYQVPTPRTWVSKYGQPLVVLGNKVLPDTGLRVQKPRCGAGSQETFLLAADAVAPRIPFIVQDYAPGTAASVSFITGPDPRDATKHALVPLCPAHQHLSSDGRFHYLGGRLPLPEPLARRAVLLATESLRPLTGLCGYLGVDLVLGDAADGSADYIIEINPRLTTSYIGLRALAEDNLAEAMLRIAEGKEIAPIRWRAGSVEFDANGAVRVL